MINVGAVFERLTVQSSIGKGYYECRCSCGALKKVRGDHLSQGKTRSCGCYRSEATTASKTTHGMRNTRTYRIWRNMHTRCTNPNIADWKYYGGRGIKVCREWACFETFFADMGAAPEYMSIDRMNTNGPYCKENCRWATAKEQANNRRAPSRIPGRLIEYDGKNYRVSELVGVLGMSQSAIYRRLERGLPVNAVMPKGIQTGSKFSAGRPA